MLVARRVILGPYLRWRVLTRSVLAGFARSLTRGDIKYVRTCEGWMYLATVIDLASRRVVGWAMAEHMRADLVCEALEMALS